VEFVYAGELKTIFDVFGHFYDLQISGTIFNCRSSLDIFSKEITNPTNALPDAVVVMMNPGSSRPLDKAYVPKVFNTEEISVSWGKETIPTRPDNAQYQIMRVMLLQRWKHVKVINLSDLRNGNSEAFSQAFENASLLDKTNPHCITHPSRRHELLESIKTKDNGPIIAAWGNVEVLRESANCFIHIARNLSGMRSNVSPWYTNASPYKKVHKMEWLRNIIKEVGKHNNRVHGIASHPVTL
jgi:hypothetical protein